MELLAEVVECERVLAELPDELLGFLLVHRLLGAFDEREHVAHAEDPRGEPVGVEWLERVGLLARPRERDRPARHRAHGEGRAAARVAIQLREDHGVDADRLVEPVRDGDGVLARHRVHDE